MHKNQANFRSILELPVRFLMRKDKRSPLMLEIPLFSPVTVS